MEFIFYCYFFAKQNIYRNTIKHAIKLIQNNLKISAKHIVFAYDTILYYY